MTQWATLKYQVRRCGGAQTQRSLQNFKIGGERLPCPMIRAMGLVKKSAAITNAALGQIPQELSGYIVNAAEEVISGQWDVQFPLVVWQTWFWYAK